MRPDDVQVQTHDKELCFLPPIEWRPRPGVMLFRQHGLYRGTRTNRIEENTTPFLD